MKKFCYFYILIILISVHIYPSVINGLGIKSGVFFSNPEYEILSTDAENNVDIFIHDDPDEFANVLNDF